MRIILYAHAEEMSVSGGISYALDTPQRGVAQVSLTETQITEWVCNSIYKTEHKQLPNFEFFFLILQLYWVKDVHK